MKLIIALTIYCLLTFILPSYSQEAPATVNDKTLSFPDKLLSKINSKAVGLNGALDKQTQRYLNRLAKQEGRLRKKISRKDVALAQRLFDGVDSSYTRLQKAPPVVSSSASVYSGRIDSVTTSLRFLKDKDIINKSVGGASVQQTLASYQQLQGRLDAAEQAKKYMQQRQELLKEHLQQLGMTKELQQFKKQVALYQSQVQEYKNMLEEPDKLQSKLLQLAQRVPAWKDFFAHNSVLGSLFALPGSMPAAANGPVAPGLQTRAMVTQGLVDRFGSLSAVNDMLQQNIPAAQNQLQQLKDKLSKYGNGSYGNGGGANADMPDYKVNPQRSKTFWRRLEWGFSLQSQKAYGVLPVTSDLGLSIGFKLSERATTGIGLSEKIGFGHGWRHLRISQQGAGIRSFLDVKLKGSIWLTGGYELNYRPGLAALDSLVSAHGVDLNYWQRSGVVGLSKAITIKSKVAKKAKMQVLWDYLSYSQRPRTPAVIWRVVYAGK
jgi:hypothetical protein